jgi:Protein of unknown function (DUF2919)
MVKKVYSLEEYDKYLCLKPSRGLWGVVLFLLLPFLTMLLTLLSGRRGGDATILKNLKNILYPNDLSLMLAFLAAMPALIFMYAWIRRKPGAPENVKKICRNGAVMLNATAIMNVIIIFVPLLTGGIRSIHWIGWVQAGLLFIIINYLRSSQRVKDTFSDFPK